MAGGHGAAVKEEVRAIAADLGVADFVFGLPLVATGGSTREPGDGLLMVGTSGAILQVKSRRPDRASADSRESANRWTAREIRKALAQARGTRREIERRLQDGECLVAEP